MQHPGFFCQSVEIIPLIFKQANGFTRFITKAYPGLVVLFKGKHTVKFGFNMPVFQLFVIEQHHAAGQAAVYYTFWSGPAAAHDSLALHITRQEFPDIGNSEYIRIYDYGASLVIHQFRRHKAQRCERLQVIVVPGAFYAIAQIELTFVCLEECVILVVDDANVELVIISRVATQCVLGYEGADNLLVVGVNKDAVLHVRQPVRVAVCDPVLQKHHAERDSGSFAHESFLRSLRLRLCIP